MLVVSNLKQIKLMKESYKISGTWIEILLNSLNWGSQENLKTDSLRRISHILVYSYTEEFYDGTAVTFSII